MNHWIEISKANLCHNFLEFQNLLGASALAPILKANAYGHGLETVYHILKNQNLPWLGVFYLEEAQTLRTLGYMGRILVLSAPLSPEFEIARELDCEIFLSDMDTIHQWSKASIRPKAHLKIDTGLGRQGIVREDWPRALSFLFDKLSDKKELKGVCMHFSNVEDVTELSYANFQLKEFFDFLKLIPSTIRETLTVHASASSSTLLLPKARYDLCRIGIALYGLWPSDLNRLSYLSLHSNLHSNSSNSSPINLKPALSWKARITTVKTIKKDSYVGYGCTYKAPRQTKIAILPVGYYEGYPRIASNKGAYVLLHGKRCPILGRISMNITIIDVSACEGVKVGDIATLIESSIETSAGMSAGIKEFISVEKLAQWSDTINYEIVTRLSANTPRIIV